jgi:hypothetical protein
VRKFAIKFVTERTHLLQWALSQRVAASANKQIGRSVIEFPQSAPTLAPFATYPLATDVLGAVMARTMGPPGAVRGGFSFLTHRRFDFWLL